MAWLLAFLRGIKPIKPSIKNTLGYTATENVTTIGDSEYFFRELIINFELMSQSFSKMIAILGQQIIRVSLELELKVPEN